MSTKPRYSRAGRNHLFKMICHLYTDPDRSLTDALTAANVPAGTFHDWLDKVAEFKEVFEHTKADRAEIARRRLRAAAEVGLKELSRARIIETRETTTDADGRVTVKVKQRYYAADPTICMYVANLPTPNNTK